MMQISGKKRHKIGIPSPWWFSDYESNCQCRGRWFNPWSDRTKILQAVECWAQAPQLLSPHSRPSEPQLLSLLRVHGLHQEEPPQWEACTPQQRVSLSLQLEKAHVQQRKPSTVKINEHKADSPSLLPYYNRGMHPEMGGTYLLPGKYLTVFTESLLPAPETAWPPRGDSGTGGGWICQLQWLQDSWCWVGGGGRSTCPTSPGTVLLKNLPAQKCQQHPPESPCAEDRPLDGFQHPW